MHDRVEQTKVNLYEELLDKCCFVCQTAISDDFVGGSIHQGADRFSDVSRAMCLALSFSFAAGKDVVLLCQSLDNVRANEAYEACAQ